MNPKSLIQQQEILLVWTNCNLFAKSSFFVNNNKYTQKELANSWKISLWMERDGYSTHPLSSLLWFFSLAKLRNSHLGKFPIIRILISWSILELAGSKTCIISHHVGAMKIFLFEGLLNGETLKAAKCTWIHLGQFRFLGFIFQREAYHSQA